MDPDEREVLMEWFDGGQPKGPATAPQSVDAVAPNDAFGEPFLRLAAAVNYVAPPEIVEEYRCFLIKSPVETSGWVSALSIETEQWERFHHAQLYVVAPERRAEVEALDGVDGRPGWSCVFNPGIDDLPLGGRFVTGLPTRNTPPGTAVWIEAGSYFVVDTHIHHYGAAPLVFDVVGWSPVVEQGDELVPVIDVVLEDRDLFIPADADDASAVVEGRVVTSEPESHPAVWNDGRIPAGLIWDIELHMHDRGERASVELVRSDGTAQCLLDIRRWDVQWQGGYRFSSPVAVEPGDAVIATCHWGNRRDNQPFINGVQNMPQDVIRGTDVDGEMCLVRLTMTPP